MADGDMHELALQLVMDWLPTQDVVSVGQVCRKWRQVAKDPFVWRKRHAPDMNRKPTPHERKLFWRVVKFAPYVRKMSVEQPEGQQDKSWAAFYEKLGKEISVKARGLRIRYGLEGHPTPQWVHRMLRRLGPHLDMLEVENPGPEDSAVIRDLILGGSSGPRILHTRTWTDQLTDVEAWPAGETPALDVLHISLVFAGRELVRVFGRTASRLELEIDTDHIIVTSAPQDISSGSTLPPEPRRHRFTGNVLEIWRLRDSHVREVVLLRSKLGQHRAAHCAQQMDLVRSALSGVVVTCSTCQGTNLCRCG